MKAVTGRDVHLDAQFVFQELLDPDQIERIEAAVRVVIYKKVEIAVGRGFVLRNRTEQIERGRSHRFDGDGLTLQSIDRFDLVHPWHFSRSGAFREGRPAIYRIPPAILFFSAAGCSLSNSPTLPERIRSPSAPSARMSSTKSRTISRLRISCG